MGDAGNDSLTGNDGADILHGGRGIDRLYGGAGADDLNGGADNDRLYGGADSDDLFGGLGGDYMNGGTGDDLFIFRQASESTVAASDSIGGFQIGADHISLMEMDANAATTGRQQFIWQGSDAFTGRGQVRIEELAGDTIVLGNLTGGLAADFRIVIAGVTGLSVSDFLLSSE